MSAPAQFVHTRGTSIIGTDGEPVRLRGICIGGWLNMENFITGFAANESMMRSGLLDVLGQDRYALFFESLLSNFFDDDDAAFLASMGVNSRPYPPQLQVPGRRCQPVRSEGRGVRPPGPRHSRLRR